MLAVVSPYLQPYRRGKSARFPPFRLPQLDL